MKRVVRIVLLVAIVIGGIMAYPYVKLYLNSVENTKNSVSQIIYVKSHASLDDLANLLVENNLIKDAKTFLKIAEYKHLDSTNLASGKYAIAPSTSMRNLVNGFFINRLGNGNAEITTNLTFNNCRDVYQLAGKAARCIEADSLELVHYLTDEKVISHYGFTENTFVALFIPDTYEMYWDCDAKAFVEKMADEYKKFWNDDRKQKAKAQNLSQSAVVTLASIVYKEQSNVAEEWPIIAGLYLNRLRDNWKLESDPTFRFCWGDKLDGVKRLTYEHRNVDCPYNTYKNFGLPPGPICIPPKGVVDAVLSPAKNNYYFMCAKPDGGGKHNFAHTYSQHLANARIYQAWLTKHNIR